MSIFFELAVLKEMRDEKMAMLGLLVFQIPYQPISSYFGNSSLFLNKAYVAVLPSNIKTLGAINSICFRIKGRQIFISSSVGFYCWVVAKERC